MTSGQVLLTRCEPSPALPSSLDEGQIWKVKVNSGSSFYRACTVWLDPGGTEGKKVRRVPYFMAARIASCACRFATPEQHAAAGDDLIQKKFKADNCSSQCCHRSKMV